MYDPGLTLGFILSDHGRAVPLLGRSATLLSHPRQFFMPAPIPPRIVREVLQQVLEKYGVVESSPLIKAYLWRGPDVSEFK